MSKNDPWQAQDDMRTLLRAKEIEADRTRHLAAKKEAAKQVTQMQKVVAKPVSSKTAPRSSGKK